MAGVKSANVYAVRLEESAYGEHRSEGFVKMQNIKVLLGQNFPYLSRQPGGQGNSCHRASNWNRYRPAYAGNLFFKISSSPSQAWSYDFDLMPPLDKMMGEISNVINDPAWKGVVIWGDQSNLHFAIALFCRTRQLLWLLNLLLFFP